MALLDCAAWAVIMALLAVFGLLPFCALLDLLRFERSSPTWVLWPLYAVWLGVGLAVVGHWLDSEPRPKVRERESRLSAEADPFDETHQSGFVQLVRKSQLSPDPRVIVTNATPPLERLKRWLVERKTKKPAQNQSVNQLLVPSVRLNPHGHPMHRDAIPGYDCPYTQAIINAPPAMKVNEQAVKQLLMDEPREVRVYRYWLFVFITVGALKGFQKRAWAVRPNVYVLSRCNREVVGDACTPELWARLYADLRAQWTIDGTQPICHKNGNTIELAVSVAEALKPYGLAQGANGEFVYHPEWIERAAHQRVLVEKVL